jgi:galactonate dehydratase
VAPEELELVDGCLIIPEKPGLGIDLNEEAAEAHPYTPHDLRHYTGALTGIRPPDARPYFAVRRLAGVPAR